MYLNATQKAQKWGQKLHRQLHSGFGGGCILIRISMRPVEPTVAYRVARNPAKLHLRPPKLQVAPAKDMQRATHTTVSIDRMSPSSFPRFTCLDTEDLWSVNSKEISFCVRPSFASLQT